MDKKNENVIQNPVVKVDFEEAKKLADLGSLAQDLGSTMKICLKIEKMLKEKSHNGLLIECLWTTALIKYSRCFKSGKRYGLGESILNGLKGKPHEVHKYMLNMRDKHLAHSVNPFEQTQIGLVLSSRGSNDKKIVGVSTLLMRHLVPDVSGVHQMGLLSKVLLEKVCVIVKEYEKKTLEKGKTIPIDDLYKLPKLKITVPGPEKINKPRN